MSRPANHAPKSAWWHWLVPCLIALGATLGGFSPLQRLDLLAYDLLSAALPAPAQSQRAVVVAIDERSLQLLGRWPWPRRVHAQLLDRLNAAPPQAIAFAILFDPPDRSDALGQDEAVDRRRSDEVARVKVGLLEQEDGDGERRNGDRRQCQEQPAAERRATTRQERRQADEIYRQRAEVEPR
ncbi:MAG TPA: CHASE2 domain-containing protein, partial [Rhodocyclaceae bacterium]|nr:CHASE2 domain-containing protein [Rhodocyclaceae bacterium]